VEANLYHSKPSSLFHRKTFNDFVLPGESFARLMALSKKPSADVPNTSFLDDRAGLGVAAARTPACILWDGCPQIAGDYRAGALW
jgi:hypothetical protein